MVFEEVVCVVVWNSLNCKVFPIFLQLLLWLCITLELLICNQSLDGKTVIKYSNFLNRKVRVNVAGNPNVTAFYGATCCRSIIINISIAVSVCI